MAVTEQSAPFAPSAAVVMLLQRNRDKGLPNPLSPEVLQRLGVGDSVVLRTLQALKTFELIEEDGKHTATLEGLRRAPEAEYKERMADWLRAVYAHTLDVVDPATATETQIRDAFRHYSPVSLQPRMVNLFTRLFEEAAVRQLGEAAPASKKQQTGLMARSAATRGGRPMPRAQSPQAPHRQQHQPPLPGASALHPALAGLLASLPAPEIGWTKDDRDRFMTAFGVVLDFAYPPGLRAAPQNAEAQDADA